MSNKAVETKTGLTLFLNGKVVKINKSNKNYKKVLGFVKAKDWKSLSDQFDSVKEEVKKYTNNQVEERDGELYLGKEKLPKVLGLRIMEMKKKRVKFDHLLKFWENLKKNPSYRSVQQLYGFLEANHFPFTKDGKFLAYKKVTKLENGKLVDSYSRTMSNDVGKVVKMNRNEVDENPEQTCSYGLHVAAWEYAQDFSGEVLLEVEVNPKDVVAVPVDYNSQKMRVCEYKVRGLAKKERKSLIV